MRKLLNKFLFDRIINSPSKITIRLVFAIIQIYHPYISFLSEKVVSLIKYCITNSAEKLIITDTGCLVVFHVNHVIKIPLCEVSMASLLKEYENYSILKKTPIHTTVGYSLFKKSKYDYIYFEMARLDTCSPRSNYMFDLITATFNTFSSIDIPLFHLKEQYRGLELMLEHASQKEKNKLVVFSEFLKKHTVQSTPMHGDMTPLNIMLIAGKPVIIDLDRFALQGLPFIDKIHYRIEKEAKDKNNNSYDEFEILCAESIESNSNNGLLELASYLFFRIGAEYRNGFVRPADYYRQSICIGLFLFNKSCLPEGK